MRSEDGKTIRLEDYSPTEFAIYHVDMTVALADGAADVDVTIDLERRAGADVTAPLVLDGDELTLIELDLDGEPVEPQRFEATPDRLTIRNLPAAGRFSLRIRTRLIPEKNTKLMGLYRSGGVWCTQCEAEGFRRITYFLDRPDVLATYRVRIEADKASAPVLLANGNRLETGDLPGERHFAVWHDPFPKPSYLFALVAGDLDVLTDRFETMTGRIVDLAIYTEKGLSERASYAMDALKRSMSWDERRFGREYDLDIFNIVAIADFNMGAMENKGLNVFNHKYVLLDPDTATDADYAGVETVIAHEYFHNWTGNRITCRDWFQLCLKEGLTVYRDQEFTSDERSRTVKRIACVHNLKAHQFPEDQGPLQHPVRPTRYREINNFYTATVYDKGAEIVRMIALILGENVFRAGMDLYFARHDGQAATLEDFVTCFEEAGGRDLSQFTLWYRQAGTPRLTVSQDFDAAAGRLVVTLTQSLEAGAAGTGTAPMHIPIRYGLVDPEGRDLTPRVSADNAVVSTDIIHLTGRTARVTFDGLTVKPMISVLRDFSAPVSLEMDQPLEDRLALARLDPNAFGRWRTLSDLVGEAVCKAARQGSAPPPEQEDVLDAMVSAIDDDALDPALRALMAVVPSETEIARLLNDNVDPEAVHKARVEALSELGARGADAFARLRKALRPPEEAFSPDAASAGRRALYNAVLGPLCLAQGDAGPASVQYDGARNMTDRMGALSVLVHHFPDDPKARGALDHFYRRFESDELVLDKWFALQATSPSASALDEIKALAAHPRFKLSNPNRARSLIGGLATANPLVFHRADGAGYRWAAEMLLALDRINPQTAARLATAFRSWRAYEPGRRLKARETLSWLLEQKNISLDLKDIVERTAG